MSIGQEAVTVQFELTSAATIAEIQVHLDRAKTAWSRAINVRTDEVNTIRQRLSALESSIARLSGDEQQSTPQIGLSWNAWWSAARQLGVSDSPPEPYSQDVSAVLDKALKQLQALRLASERRRDAAVRLLSDVSRPPAAPSAIEPAIRDRVRTAEQEVQTARKALAEAEEGAARERRLQVELREGREELRALAQLALRHLGDKCPVCGQEYDETAARHRLSEYFTAAEAEKVNPPATTVKVLAQSLEERERTLRELQKELRETQQAIRDYDTWVQEQNRRLNELGLTPVAGTTQQDALREFVSQIQTVINSFAEQQKKGEQLSLDLARITELARKREIESEAATVRKELDQQLTTLRSYEETGDLAGQILEHLREAATDVVREQVTRVEPLLARVFSRIDPHPAFRIVKLLTSFTYRRGRLSAAVVDPSANIQAENLKAVLSSSQANALAASVFLALNLGAGNLPLSVVMLDDPLQSLDDVNLLGLIDVLRRVRETRQLIISTHDLRFARLLERKLRPVKQGQRTRVIEFQGWSRQGPVVSERSVFLNQEPLRIAV